MKIGPFDEAEIAPPALVFLQHVRAGDVRGHQVGRELDALELDVEDPGQRADHQRLGQARHADQQAVAAGEDGGEDLLDHVRLADDDLLQFFLHQPAMLAELLQHVAEVSRFGADIRGQGSGARGQGPGIREIMAKHEGRRNGEIRSSKSEVLVCRSDFELRASDFVIPSSLVIRASSFTVCASSFTNGIILQAANQTTQGSLVGGVADLTA